MEPTFFPVQRSLPLAFALAERVLPGYDLPRSTVCRFWQRSINDAYLVETEAAKFVLRISPANWRSYAHLKGEIDLLRFLERQDFLVPQPIPRKDGAYIQTLNAPEGPRHAVLFSFVPGVSLPFHPTEAQSQLYGQVIARLHRVTDDYPLDRAAWRFEPEEMVDEPLARLEPLFADRPDDFRYLVEIGSTLKRATERLDRQTPEYGLCHGDVNHRNFHLLDGDRWALLDFEYLGYGWRLFDIGAFFGNQLYQLGQGEQAQGLLDAFLQGYQSVRPLSQTELQALPSFVILRQLWLMGIGARNVPNVGLRLIQDWFFEHCLPLIRGWMQTL